RTSSRAAPASISAAPACAARWNSRSPTAQRRSVEASPREAGRGRDPLRSSGRLRCGDAGSMSRASAPPPHQQPGRPLCGRPRLGSIAKRSNGLLLSAPEGGEGDEWRARREERGGGEAVRGVGPRWPGCPVPTSWVERAMANHDVVAIGASAGGFQALSHIAKRLPGDFPAAVLVTIHLHAEASNVLPDLIDRAGPLPAAFARDG